MLQRWPRIQAVRAIVEPVARTHNAVETVGTQGEHPAPQREAVLRKAEHPAPQRQHLASVE